MRILKQNLVKTSSLTCSSEALSFPVNNLKHIHRSKWWTTQGCSSEWVMVDLGVATPFNSFVCLFAKEDDLGITDSAVFTLELGNELDSETDALIVEETYNLVYSDLRQQMSHYFNTTKTFRYVKVSFQDSGNVKGHFVVGNIFVSLAENLQPAQNGFNFKSDDQTELQRNKYGTVYGDRYPKLLSLSLKYDNLYYNEIQVLETIHNEMGSSEPIFVVVDPFQVVFNKDHFSIYGLLSPGFTLSHVNYTIFNASGLTITELN